MTLTTNFFTSEERPVKRKDPGMAERTAEELYKLPGSNRDIARRIGCSHKLISAWTTGRYAPSAYHLKSMYEAGLDVIYILTGRRTN